MKIKKCTKCASLCSCVYLPVFTTPSSPTALRKSKFCMVSRRRRKEPASVQRDCFVAQQLLNSVLFVWVGFVTSANKVVVFALQIVCR